MTMTLSQSLISIAIMAGLTFVMRLCPFLIFGGKQKPSRKVLYLGVYLPAAIIAMLVVYCFRNVTPLAYPYGIPELIAIVTVVLLHLWKHNNLISIFGGTFLYMMLVQFVFC